MTTVVATPGQGPDRPQEVSYTDIKVSKTGQDHRHQRVLWVMTVQFNCFMDECTEEIYHHITATD